ncbi:hypothetical protein CRYUN_Cryun28dG0005700 [Craigia yunnanensis]
MFSMWQKMTQAKISYKMGLTRPVGKARPIAVLYNQDDHVISQITSRTTHLMLTMIIIRKYIKLVGHAILIGQPQLLLMIQAHEQSRGVAHS